MTQQNALAEPDRRIWMYRANPSLPEGFEGLIFKSPDYVPEGQGWVDTPAKLKILARAENGAGPRQDRTEEPGNPDDRRLGDCSGDIPKEAIATIAPSQDAPLIRRYRANGACPDGIEICDFPSVNHVPGNAGWAEDRSTIKLDLSVWMYRANPAHPNGVEGVIFESPNHVPDGEGWENSPAKIKPKHKDDHNGERASETGNEPAGHVEGAKANRACETGSGRRHEGQVRHGQRTPTAERRPECGRVQQVGAAEGATGEGRGDQSAQPDSGQGHDGQQLEAPHQTHCRKRSLNFNGLSRNALIEIAEKAGVSVARRWPRARIEQALKEAE